MKEFIAHVALESKDTWKTPHDLAEHCLSVGDLAAQFAQNFGPEFARAAGRWHDLGKYREKFQNYIRDKSGYERENAHIENSSRVTHSTAGALYAVEKVDERIFGILLAYLIAGHHAGLGDWVSEEAGRGSIKNRLKSDESKKEYQEAFSAPIPEELLKIPDFKDDLSLNLSCENVHVWMRMLFSCLVDADFLDTDRYMSPANFAERGLYPQLPELNTKYQQYMAKIAANANNETKKRKHLNTIRQNILQECLIAADCTEHIFSLTVPTGGGKTLASLGFALKHALKNKQSRIIYAIPFTSIIEQNADVFRDCLGQDSVVEHHSNLEEDNNENSIENNRRRLATENWDAPLIVTTNVQLFESLFGSRTSRCRKLHNIANSVIILDEAQQIPREFLKPITHMMKELSLNYGVTWVLCTATQPKLNQQKDAFERVLLEGLNDIKEIISDPIKLAQDLKRVKINFPEVINNKVQRTLWSDLTEQIFQEETVLAIVNTRKDAQNLFNLLSINEKALHFHLSANMCAEHRTEILSDIKRHLKDKNRVLPLRVVSTPIVEAGVDVDFPVVYRSICGLDSIAQSAGRCNRENSLGEGIYGKVNIFLPEKDAPSGALRQGQNITEDLLIADLLKDPLSPDSFADYFKRFNAQSKPDHHGIMPLLKTDVCHDEPITIKFKTVAKKFKMIPETGLSVIVPFLPLIEESKINLKNEDDFLINTPIIIEHKTFFRAKKSPIDKLIGCLENDASQSWVYRKLQRYSVTLHENTVKEMTKEGAILSKAGLLILIDSRYSNLLGVLPPDSLLSPEDSVFF